MRNPHLYPKDWRAIAKRVKIEACGTCEECGRPCRRPGETDQQLSDRLADTPWALETHVEIWDEDTGESVVEWKYGRFTLTTAHLDQNPGNNERPNLRALCPACHLEYDRPWHQKKAAATRFRKKQAKLESLGQITLPIAL